MEISNTKADFEDKNTTFLSTELVAPSDINDSEKNYFNDNLQEVDSPYFS